MHFYNKVAILRYFFKRSNFNTALLLRSRIIPSIFATDLGDLDPGTMPPWPLPMSKALLDVTWTVSKKLLSQLYLSLAMINFLKMIQCPKYPNSHKAFTLEESLIRCKMWSWRFWNLFCVSLNMIEGGWVQFSLNFYNSTVDVP